MGSRDYFHGTKHRGTTLNRLLQRGLTTKALETASEIKQHTGGTWEKLRLAGIFRRGAHERLHRERLRKRKRASGRKVPPLSLCGRTRVVIVISGATKKKRSLSQLGAGGLTWR